ncbi:MAG: hypothetical protein E7667_02530 [Ruminococcaceae bacterium]|nr:hypothetical protein [Oscillospiraceae bacterium]
MDITDDAAEAVIDTQDQSVDEQRREYDELIRTKYKKFYTEDTQKMINRRFRKYKELEARAEQLEKEKAQFEKRLTEETEKSAREAEDRLISGIRARYLRPGENGILTAKVPSKRDVSSLTRSQRADMARRASKGETIKI